MIQNYDDPKYQGLIENMPKEVLLDYTRALEDVIWLSLEANEEIPKAFHKSMEAVPDMVRPVHS